MSRGGDYFETLFVGEDRKLTRAASLVACSLILVAAIVDYVALSLVIAGDGPAVFAYIRQAFRLHAFWDHGLTPTTWVYGYLLVAGLAGIHAYFNVGYLTSVLLALSPNIGTALWSIHGFDEYVTLTPILVFERVLPEGPLVATFGFLLGFGLRKVAQPKPARETPEPDVPRR